MATEAFTHERAYFKNVRLGDFIHRRPEVTFHHTPPEFRPAVGARRAKASSGGASAYFTVRLSVAFVKGYRDPTEGRSAFWDRVLSFGEELMDAVTPETGHKRAGPLSIIRDVNGQRFKKDSATLTGAVTAGSPKTIPVGTDVSTGSYSWKNDQLVLFIDPDNPTTFDWETAVIKTIGPTSFDVYSLDYQKQIDAKVFRIERLWPEVALFEDFTIPTEGQKTGDFVQNIPLVFAGVVDVLPGGLES